jgi:hypothetical protein
MLTNELKKLEHEEYGLAEALEEARTLKKCLIIRDKDIEKLVKSANEIQAKLDEITDQNWVLRYRLKFVSVHKMFSLIYRFIIKNLFRERLGLGADSEIDVRRMSEIRTSERHRSEVLLKQIAALEAERLTLKLEVK